jgi:hypothetical protein
MSVVAVYFDRFGGKLLEQVEASGCLYVACAAYMFDGRLEQAQSVCAPDHPHIVAAYAAAGIPEFVPAEGAMAREQIKPKRLPKVVVLSGGPSGIKNLERFRGLPIIGINTMPLLVECDYWIAMDPFQVSMDAVGKTAPVGDPIRVVSDYFPEDQRGKWIRLEDYAQRLTWTSITAVNFATAIADEVYCLGFDWCHEKGSDGIDRSSSRNWAHEEQMFNDVRRTSPCKIVRVGYDTEAQEVPQKKARSRQRKG